MSRRTRVYDESAEGGDEDRVQIETPAETTHEDMAVKDAVKEIFSRMDAQFREIKESLYVSVHGCRIWMHLCLFCRNTLIKRAHICLFCMLLVSQDQRR